jgi:hypothetical protein
VSEGRQVATSIALVEDFYAEPLSRHLQQVVIATPLEQLLVLASRLRLHFEHVEHALEIRNSWRQESRLEVATAQALPATYSYLLTTGLTSGEEMLGCRSATAGEPVSLKHAILYREALLYPDSLFGWADNLLNLHDAGYVLGEAEFARDLAWVLAAMPRT